MPGPLIYISTWRVKEGRLGDFKQFVREFLGIIEAKVPQLIAFHAFLNEEESEVTYIQVHPDSDSMDFHMQMVEQVLGEDMGEWIERADFIEPKHIEIYGTPSTALLEADQPAVDEGIPRKIKPRYITGFTRSTAV